MFDKQIHHVRPSQTLRLLRPSDSNLIVGKDVAITVDVNPIVASEVFDQSVLGVDQHKRFVVGIEIEQSVVYDPQVAFPVFGHVPYGEVFQPVVGLVRFEPEHSFMLFSDSDQALSYDGHPHRAGGICYNRISITGFDTCRIQLARNLLRKCSGLGIERTKSPMVSDPDPSV